MRICGQLRWHVGSAIGRAKWGEHSAASCRALLFDHGKIPEIRSSWPVIEDPASYGYYREEGGGLMIGLFEALCAPWNVGGIPDDFLFGTVSPDWDRMGPYVETAMQRVPISCKRA